MGQRAAIYARVSTADQSCERQIAELTAFADRGGFGVLGIFKETALGARNNRLARNRVLELAQARRIDAVLVTELSRWGRSTQDLLETLYKLVGWKVSVVAMSGMTFELDTPHGRMMATMLAGITQFERDLLSERVKSGLAAARARSKKLGRQPGHRPKSDRLAPKVLHAVDGGRSYRWIARDLDQEFVDRIGSAVVDEPRNGHRLAGKERRIAIGATVVWPIVAASGVSPMSALYLCPAALMP